MTADEFLAGRQDAGRRRVHLVDGKLHVMSPASSVHARIQGNLAFLLESAARAGSSTLAVSIGAAVLPALTAGNNVRVPDLLLAEAEAERGDLVVMDPVVVAEILSPGMSPVTRGNVRAYATLGSVREIVVVSTSRMEIEIYRRTDDDEWLPDVEVVKRGDQFAVRSVGLSCRVEDIYRGTWLALRAGDER